MIRRIPVWLTLAPLLLAGLLYWIVWSGWARDFKAAVEQWLPGETVSVGGFPYRIEAAVDQPRLRLQGIVRIEATASRSLVNRGPWQPELTVVRAENPRFLAAVDAFGQRTALQASVEGKSALTSIHLDNGKLARLSAVVEAARARIGFIAAPLTADTLEVHLREVPGRLPEPWSPTLPARGQAVITGERLRIAGGDALTINADMAVTGRARLTDFAAWADGGTVELRELRLSDAHGEVARAAATLVPAGRTGVRLAGTIDTICPASLAAALTGAPGAAELRLREPVRLAIQGVIDQTGAVSVTGLPADLATRARRAQLPPCPRLHG
jgi:hypothetical protein